ncbi:MAG: hypothetical protein WC768_03355 [Patescibacteria group bacterium]
MNSKKGSRNVVAAGFGATSDFTVRVYSPTGNQKVVEAKVPWQTGKGGAIYWPLDWLQDMMKAVRSYAGRGDLIAGAMPGADLVFLKSGFPLKARHYPSTPEGVLAEITAKIPALELYMATGGANVDFYQPYCQLAAMFASRSTMWNTDTIVPLADWLTGVLHNWRVGLRADQVMWQSQGLATLTSEALYRKLFGKDLAAKLFRSDFFRRCEVVRDRASGAIIVPVTHDSVPARMVGFSQCPWVIWSGTWLGIAFCLLKHLGIKPTAQTFAAGIAFEGIGSSRAAITNIAQLGRAYKWMIGFANWDYATAALQANTVIDCTRPYDLTGMPTDEAEAKTWLRELYNKRSPQAAIAGLLKSAALACHQKLEATAGVLRLAAPTEISVIGGWAQNSAFINALRKLGYKVHIPPFAAEATHAGLAADALVRVGDAKTFNEALAMLR